MQRIIVDPPATAGTGAAESGVFDSPRARLDFYRHEIHFESSLLSNRTNAYLSAQSFLVIAYASSMANVNASWGHLFTLVVPTLLALLGMVSSMHAWPGIRASYEIICHWQFKQRQLLASEPAMGQAYDDSPLFSDWENSKKGYHVSLLFSLRTPWIFSAFWLMLGGFSLWAQLR
ncbi:hypothetical protein [Pseudomonas typographi]|uniref:Uncharacterized protein n=1 Tax=Pseudomonas typographi TaxID=2715964 RepID=A0ABR7Z1D8_9PSED|nr:hypothetical protein [Pseudomonas typographi]MBD1551689.1 hypothetical protein [Pseudomonas typographi]MBD1587056.1 hypothetical protein [Pseudomonas typographi]MBD1599295.1 hypothetical protein [Pseudomonas typographi]